MRADPASAASGVSGDQRARSLKAYYGSACGGGADVRGNGGAYGDRVRAARAAVRGRARRSARSADETVGRLPVPLLRSRRRASRRSSASATATSAAARAGSATSSSPACAPICCVTDTFGVSLLGLVAARYARPATSPAPTSTDATDACIPSRRASCWSAGVDEVLGDDQEPQRDPRAAHRAELPQLHRSHGASPRCCRRSRPSSRPLELRGRPARDRVPRRLLRDRRRSSARAPTRARARASSRSACSCGASRRSRAASRSACGRCSLARVVRRRRRGELRDARADDHRRHHAARAQGQGARRSSTSRSRSARRSATCSAASSRSAGAGATAFFVAGGPGIVLALSCLLIVEPPRKLAVAAKGKVIDGLKTMAKHPAVPPRGARLLRVHRGDRRVLVLGADVPHRRGSRPTLDLDRARTSGSASCIRRRAARSARSSAGSWADRARARSRRAARGRRRPRRVRRTARGINALLRICAIGMVIATPLTVRRVLHADAAGCSSSLVFVDRDRPVPVDVADQRDDAARGAAARCARARWPRRSSRSTCSAICGRRPRSARSSMLDELARRHARARGRVRGCPRTCGGRARGKPRERAGRAHARRDGDGGRDRAARRRRLTLVPGQLFRGLKIRSLLGGGAMGTRTSRAHASLRTPVVDQAVPRGAAPIRSPRRTSPRAWCRRGRAGARRRRRARRAVRHPALRRRHRSRGAARDPPRRGSRDPGADARADRASTIFHGLSAIHVAGVVHRDIKPPNLFLAGSGEALVGDFGIAVDPNGGARRRGRRHADVHRARDVGGRAADAAQRSVLGGRDAAPAVAAPARRSSRRRAIELARMHREDAYAPPRVRPDPVARVLRRGARAPAARRIRATRPESRARGRAHARAHRDAAARAARPRRRRRARRRRRRRSSSSATSATATHRRHRVARRTSSSTMRLRRGERAARGRRRRPRARGAWRRARSRWVRSCGPAPARSRCKEVAHAAAAIDGAICIQRAVLRTLFEAERRGHRVDHVPRARHRRRRRAARARRAPDARGDPHVRGVRAAALPLDPRSRCSPTRPSPRGRRRLIALDHEAAVSR